MAHVHGSWTAFQSLSVAAQDVLPHLRGVCVLGGFSGLGLYARVARETWPGLRLSSIFEDGQVPTHWAPIVVYLPPQNQATVVVAQQDFAERAQGDRFERLESPFGSSMFVGTTTSAHGGVEVDGSVKFLPWPANITPEHPRFHSLVRTTSTVDGRTPIPGGHQVNYLSWPALIAQHLVLGAHPDGACAAFFLICGACAIGRFEMAAARAHARTGPGARAPPFRDEAEAIGDAIDVMLSCGERSTVLPVWTERLRHGGFAQEAREWEVQHVDMQGGRPRREEESLLRGYVEVQSVIERVLSAAWVRHTHRAQQDSLAKFAPTRRGREERVAAFA